MLTNDPKDPRLQNIIESGPHKGQQQVYLVLSDEERAKGFVRPVRTEYKHLTCGSVTTMGLALSETYARNPKFYGGTFCCRCGTHFRLLEWNAHAGRNECAFEWEPDGDPVGSDAEEAQAYLEAKKQAENNKHKGAGI